MKTKVGFLGLGNMGLPMARNLGEAGCLVQVFDVAEGARDVAGKMKGLTVTNSPAAAVAGVDVVFTVLPNDEIVTEVYLGENGIAEGGKPGLITCDCSTVSPEVSENLYKVMGDKGIHHMDTPMLGSTPQADSGDIFFIVGGDEQHLPTISPLLEILGKMHMHVGGTGTGNRIKLIHNILGAVNSVAVAESLMLCAETGVDPQTYLEVVANGGGMAYSTYFGKRVERILNGEYSPTFSLELMHKDVSLAMNLAGDEKALFPIMGETLRAYEEGVEGRLGKEDFSSVTKVIEKRSGRKIVG